MAAAVVVERLVKRYGAHAAVSRVTFTVAAGELVGIVGPDGAGKTTTIECIQGWRRPDAGRVSLLGMDPHTDRRALHGRVGYHPQAASLPGRIRVTEAVACFAALQPLPVDPAAVLDRWGLAAHRDAKFRSLAGGERRRLFLALAFLGQPEVVFLDEVTGSDIRASDDTWELIEDARRRGVTIVVVTPFPEEAERCDRILVFDAGSLVESDTPDELVRRHGGGISFRFAHPAIDVDWILRIPGVGMLHHDADTVQVWGIPECLPRVQAGLAGRDVVPQDLRVDVGNLDDAVRSLTGMVLAA